VRFLDPVYPPAPGPNPEAQYVEMTAEIRRRVVEAYDELRGVTDRQELVAAGQ